MISLYGYDGFMYSVGWLVAYITVLLIVAEPCRNAGKYTLGDILSFRTSPKPVRAVAAMATVAVTTFYLTAQMVGAGKLMALLVGVSYKTSIIGVGILMVGYVVFGGMTATTWVQIIKAGLLMSGALLLSVLVMAKAGFNPIGFFSDVVNSPNIQDHVSKLVLRDGVNLTGEAAGQRFLESALFMKNPLDQISLGMALVLGTIASIVLVMVSPNMTYPKVVAAGAQKVITAMEKKQAALPPGAQLEEKDAKALAKAKTDYEKNKDGTSIMGLDKPILTLKNPGIISIPLGFIAAILAALIFPSKKAEEMWDELYVRQNTGIGMAKAIDH